MERGSDATATLLKALGDVDDAAQAGIVSVLHMTMDDIDPDALVTALLGALPRLGDEALPQALRVLGKSGDSRVYDALVGSLASDNGQVRMCAVEALGDLGDVRAVEPLLACLDDDSGFVHGSVMTVLGTLAPAQIMPYLIHTLREDDDFTRADAATVVVKIGPEAVAPLLAALPDAPPGQRLMIAWTLGQIGDARAVTALAGLLQDGDKFRNERIDKTAADALKQIGTDEAKAALAAWQQR